MGSHKIKGFFSGIFGIYHQDQRKEELADVKNMAATTHYRQHETPFITLSASSVLLDLTRRSNPLILWLLYGINQL